MEFIFNKFEEYVLITDTHGKIIFCSDRLLNKLGYINEEIVGFDSSKIIANNDIELGEILNEKYDLKVQLRFISKENESIYVDSKICVADFKEKKSIFIISKEVDLNNYTTEHLEIVLDNIEYGAFIKDTQGKYLYANKPFAKIARCGKDKIIGTYDIDHWEKKLSDQYASADREVIQCKKAKLFNELTNIDGEDLWYESYKAPIYNQDGTPRCVVGIVRNINLEKTVKEELYENYNQITSLTSLNENKEKSTDMYHLLKNIGNKILNGLGGDGLSILIYDKEKKGLIPYIKLNHSNITLEKTQIIPLDYNSAKEVIRNPKGEGLKTKEEWIAVNGLIGNNNLEDVEYIGSYLIKLKDELLGNISVCFKKGNPPQSNRDYYMKSICNKIAMIVKNCRLSEEIKIENSKRVLTERELELYLNVAVDLIAVIGSDGYFKKISPSWVDVLGWSEEELLTRHCKEFIHPADYGSVLEYISNEENKSEINRIGVRYRCKDGRYIWLDWSSKYIEKDGLYITTARDITQQKEMEEQKRKLEETVQLESIKNEFFANISHEFRTPLNIILGTMQLTKKNIEQNTVNIDSLSKHTNIIKQNSYRLLRLVNNLIDISRIDIGFYNLQPSNQNIINVIEDITLSVAYYVENKNIELIFDTDIEELTVSCDPDKIERVILNILSNAIKYTPEYGTINVNIKKDEENVIVSIKDSGTGIPKEKLDIIFDRFGQANSMFSRRCEGSGIGLSLVKSIVEMHGGNIYVYSEIGKGSEFVFNIPIKVLDEDVIVSSGYDNKEYLIEKCHIEFSDIYN